MDTKSAPRLIIFALLMFSSIALLAEEQATATPPDTLTEKAARLVREKYGIPRETRLTLGPMTASMNPDYYQSILTVEDTKGARTEIVSISRNGKYLAESEMYPLAPDTIPEIMRAVGKAYGLPAGTPVTVEPLQPSATAGFELTIISFSEGDHLHTEGYFVTNDHRFLVLGSVYTIREPEEIRQMIKTTGELSAGLEHAPVTIVEFTDFECPECARIDRLLSERLPKYRNLIRLVYKDFPLPYHAWAKTAAIANRCVNQISPSQSSSYRAVIFAHQSDIDPKDSRDALLNYAEELGVNRLQLAACVDAKGPLPLIESNIEEGRRLEIAMTPTFFIEGRMLAGKRTAEAIDVALDIARSMASKGLVQWDKDVGNTCGECSVSPAKLRK